MNIGHLDILVDGDKFWLNNEYQCLARLSPLGMEVWDKKGSRDLDGTYFFKKGPINADDWILFLLKIKEFYNLDVPGEKIPKFIKIMFTDTHIVLTDATLCGLSYLANIKYLRLGEKGTITRFCPECLKQRNI